MDNTDVRPKWHKLAAPIVFLSVALIAACNGGGGDSGSPTPPPVTPPTPPVTKLVCDDTMKAAFQPDANTTVLLVKAFKKNDPLLLTGTPTSTTPVAANDVCVVKLNVGPGNPGPAGAPSTSPGIGVEIWLPTEANWNNRIHVMGGGGWAGGVQGSLTALAGAGSAGPIAGVEGAVSATTDTGHSVGSGSFAMNPDGSINQTLWADFAYRGIHEMAVKTKALTTAYYGRAAKYSYWDGFSTGGRQGHMEAQANPSDFNGILAGAPVVNWTRFITNELYPQIVYQRDLGGVPLSTGQLTLLGNAAINACDLTGGQHLGYIPDPSTCRYDPTQDPSVICTANGGTNATANCVTQVQAVAMNKIWYGQTADGSVPSPATDNSFALIPGGLQRWYGLTRGSSSGLAGATPFTISSDMVALELQDPTIATTGFTNATGNGADRWKALSYEEMSHAFDRGLALQAAFGGINTDNPDLSAFRDGGGKLVVYHGLADVLVPPQGTINYINRVATQMGGLSAIQSFYRFYLVPGMSHGFANGTTNASANPPLPTRDQLYAALTDWVEKGIAPTRIEATSLASPVKTRPICLYPQKATYTGGDVNVSASYTCS